MTVYRPEVFSGSPWLLSVFRRGAFLSVQCVNAPSANTDDEPPHRWRDRSPPPSRTSKLSTPTVPLTPPHETDARGACPISCRRGTFPGSTVFINRSGLCMRRPPQKASAPKRFITARAEKFWVRVFHLAGHRKNIHLRPYDETLSQSYIFSVMTHTQPANIHCLIPDFPCKERGISF